MVLGCGIPKITIEGTAADWQKLYTKVEALEKYDLAWWTNEITPLLKEFIHAANKKVNPDFWRNMFKYHEKGSGIYKSTAIDGWMIKFFPYNKQGQRNNLDSLTGSANLPDEICKVDVLHQFIDEAGNITQTPLEFCAGFIGLKQDGANFTLKPEIGWFVKRKDSLNALIVQELEEKNKSGNIHIRVNEIPAELLGLPAISNLYVEFTGDILIPEQMKKLSIATLVLSGKTSDEKAQRITAMFPNTTVIINKKDYRNPGKKPSELMLGLGW